MSSSTFVVPCATHLLEHMRNLSASNTWPGDSLEHIQHWMLTREKRLTNVGHMQQAVDLMLTTIPASMPAVHTLHSSPAKRVAQLLPPLMVWAKEQPWGARLDLASLGYAALDYLHHPNAMQSDNLAASVVAAQLLSQTVEHAADSQDAWTLVGPWIINNPRLWPTDMARWLELEENAEHVEHVARAWVAVGIAAEKADSLRGPHETSTLLSYRWSHNFKASVAFVDHANEMTLASTVASSNASASVKSTAFSWFSAAAWTHPHAVLHFANALPADDVQRACALPWSRLNPKINQDLSRLYLPLTAQLLESLAPPTVWSDKALYTAWVANLATARTLVPDALALPDASDLFPDPYAP